MLGLLLLLANLIVKDFIFVKTGLDSICDDGERIGNRSASGCIVLVIMDECFSLENDKCNLKDTSNRRDSVLIKEFQIIKNVKDKLYDIKINWEYNGNRTITDFYRLLLISFVVWLIGYKSLYIYYYTPTLLLL